MARRYIQDALGERYAEGVILDVEKVWEESDCRTPLVGLLSMGSDPTQSIESLAKKHKIGKIVLYNINDRTVKISYSFNFPVCLSSS